MMYGHEKKAMFKFPMPAQTPASKLSKGVFKEKTVSASKKKILG